jgi:hypothetical protein
MHSLAVATVRDRPRRCVKSSIRDLRSSPSGIDANSKTIAEALHVVLPFPTPASAPSMRADDASAVVADAVEHHKAGKRSAPRPAQTKTRRARGWRGRRGRRPSRGRRGGAAAHLRRSMGYRPGVEGVDLRADPARLRGLSRAEGHRGVSCRRADGSSGSGPRSRPGTASGTSGAGPQRRRSTRTAPRDRCTRPHTASASSRRRSRPRPRIRALCRCTAPARASTRAPTAPE